MKDTKYKILAYFDNQSYRKLFNEVNSDYAENLQILLHNLSLFSYDVLIIGVILYKENISNIISAIRKITQIPIIILTDASSLLCMSWKKELIYAGADCVMDIKSSKKEKLFMVLLVVDAQNGIVDERLYAFRKFVGNIKKLIGAAREQGIEVIYVQHDDGPGTGFSIGDDEFEVYSEFQPMPDEKRFIKSVCSAFKKESGLLEYLTAKEEKDVMICGIMTDFCINATVEAGFEHGLHMIVPAYANSTQDNEYMTREQAYHYYNEFLWPERYADCVPMDRALELLKK